MDGSPHSFLCRLNPISFPFTELIPKTLPISFSGRDSVNPGFRSLFFDSLSLVERGNYHDPGGPRPTSNVEGLGVRTLTDCRFEKTLGAVTEELKESETSVPWISLWKERVGRGTGDGR